MNFQILRSTPRTLQLTVYSAGTAVNLDANPTIVVTNGAGSVVASGAVTKPGATTGIYESILPAQANLNVLTAVWTGLLATQAVTFTQTYEIVGNLLFTEAEARGEQIVGGQLALADTKYSDALIAHWRSVVGDIFETRMNRGVVRRYCRTRFSGFVGLPLDLSGGYPVLASGSPLHRPGRAWDISRIISATVDGVAQTVGELEIVGYKLYHTTSTWAWSTSSTPLNITVEYEYGPDPVESETHQRALDLLLANAAPSGYPSTATSLSNEDGTFRISNFPVAVEEFLKRRNNRTGL